MASDIPSQISFEEMLSHTFPGFFSAITLFMLMAIFSPIDITSWAIKDLSSLGLFIGFILLGGTILGIIIDDIHHSIVEDGIFENIVGLRKIKAVLDAISPGSSELRLGHQYFFQKIGEKQDPTKIFEFIIKSIYRYSEFYANTFISLVPFSLVAPFYLSKVLQIQWSYSILFGLVSLIVACFCLNGSYVAFKEYQTAKLSAICGYLGYEEYIELKIKPRKEFYDCNTNNGVELEARIFDKSNSQIKSRGIKIIFNNTFGENEHVEEVTNISGVARTKLFITKCEKCKTVLITATSKGLCSKDCVPGVTWVEVRKGE